MEFANILFLENAKREKWLLICFSILFYIGVVATLIAFSLNAIFSPENVNERLTWDIIQLVAMFVFASLLMALATFPKAMNRSLTISNNGISIMVRKKMTLHILPSEVVRHDYKGRDFFMHKYEIECEHDKSIFVRVSKRQEFEKAMNILLHGHVELEQSSQTDDGWKPS